MQPEQWRQIEQLYHAALERAPGARTAFLHEACADSGVRQEVESLLAYDERAAAFITSPPDDIAAEMFAAEQASTLIGSSLAHYQILARLGQGGMGEVYLATDTKLGRKVAVKLLPAEFMQDAERVRRFQQEARAASALNHPNIITIYEIGEAEQRQFIVTEYIEGETLREQLRRGPLSLAAALDAARQVASALEAAHTAGIVHRDIKPENVMVRRDSLIKVLDFGLAKLTAPQFAAADSAAPTAPQVSTQSGLVLGTTAYMSPEQARGQKVDYRTDIFSLGVLLYELIAGQRPFVGATASETIAAILRDEPQPLAQQAPACPATLERIINRCLAKTPEQRYQAASELSAELTAARAALAESKQPATAAEEKASIIQRTEKAPWRLAALGSVALLIILAAAFYYFRNVRDTAETAIKTLAVLPPRPLQAGERDEALEMGAASMLITRLGSLQQLIVRPESAVEKYARPEHDPLAAGREQKVDAVLDSRYQRSGDRFRFTLRLLRVADGATLWADTLDQPAADLFALEDALSLKVTSALRLRLSSAEKELLTKRYTNSREAWALYVRGRHLLHLRGKANTEKANTYFERALALDPHFALAYATLGHSCASLSWNVPDEAARVKARAAHEQALKLDDQLAEAHSFLACYKQSAEWDYPAAAQHHQRALELNPNSADVRLEHAYFLAMLGRFEQAIPEIRKAEELDPTDEWISRVVALVLFYAGRYDEAIEQSRRVLDLNSNSAANYDWIIRVYEAQGDEQNAFAAAVKRAEVGGATPEVLAAMKAAFAAGGWQGFLRFRLARLLEREKREAVTQWDIARLYAQLGEKEQALARLQRAVEDRNFMVGSLKIEPNWDSYRDDPRFVALVRRVGLAP